jgi:hypothetical protein
MKYLRLPSKLEEIKFEEKLLALQEANCSILLSFDN